MSMGLEAAGGLAAVRAALRQQLMDRLAIEDRNRQTFVDDRNFDRRSVVEDRNFDLQNKQFQSGEELKKAQLDATIQARGAQEEDRKAGLASKLADTIPGDTFIGANDPAVKTMAGGGYQSLLTPQDATLPMGRDFVGPMPNGETPQQAQVGRPQGFLKVRSAKQADTETDNQRQAAKDAAGAQEKAAELIRQQARDAETGRHNRAEESAAAGRGNEGHFSAIPQYDETGRPVGSFSFDSRHGTVQPLMGPDGTPVVTKPAPGAGQLAQQEQHKKEARSVLDRLDQDIETAKAKLGPTAGRVSDVEQWIGNGDPDLQRLGTNMMLAKMKVDAGLGGMRAAASPQLLGRWDKLMGNNVTPEGLHATVQAMREMVGGEAKTTDTSHPPMQKFGATYTWDGTRYVRQQ